MNKFQFSSDAIEELEQAISNTNNDFDIESFRVHPEDFPHFLPEVKQSIETVRANKFIVIGAVRQFSVAQNRLYYWIYYNLVGEPLPQNEQGNRLIEIYDRIRTGSMTRGARYHQTREGGSMHTDNVNDDTPWDFLAFGALSSAMAGGESIIVDGDVLYKELDTNFPDVLEILKQDFQWERRGIAESFYQAPIVRLDNNGNPHYRYLRIYMESAYEKQGITLSMDQLYALDTLDALLDLESMQTRFLVQPGEILFCEDERVFHGRTCFSDAKNAVDISTYMETGTGTLKRTLERAWIRERK